MIIVFQKIAECNNTNELRLEWLDTIKSVCIEDRTIDFVEQLKEDYYSDGEYIFDTETGELTEGNEYFHKNVYLDVRDDKNKKKE